MTCLLRTLLLTLAVTSFAVTSPLFANTKLDRLEKELKKELHLLGYPAPSWREHSDTTCDVAIIGSGMLGTAVAYALHLEGIYNVQVFDAADKGKEGPWLTSARMKTLRSGKELQGPALHIPKLTFRAWYEAQYGRKAWKKLGKIPTQMWGNYLIWMKKVLHIKVHNMHRLTQIIPNDDETLTLMFANAKSVRTKKVVLATGRGGFGGFEAPGFLQGIPKKFWAHSSEEIDPRMLKKKQVCVIGAGASAFDAAGYALENRAKEVMMLVRRHTVPKDNFFAIFGHTGFKYGYYFLSDEKRCELFVKAYSEGIPPPAESIQRIESYPNFSLLAATCIEKVQVKNDKLLLQTNHGELSADFLFLGTGYAVDASRQPELALFHEKIMLWKDRLIDLPSKLGRFPYLGPYFELLEKVAGEAPYLQHIHCFNYGAFLSHGRISGDIDCIDTGIKRLVQGIAVNLFLKDMKEESPFVPECPNTCQTGLETGFCKYSL